MKKKIILIGPIPPPYGGVSIHLSRLNELLKTENEVIIINTSIKLASTFKVLFIFLHFLSASNKEVYIHNHTSNLFLNFYLTSIAKFFSIKYIQTLHSFRIGKNLSSLESYLLLSILRKSNLIISVSKEISLNSYLNTNDIKPKVVLQNAFIPPQQEISKSDLLINGRAIEDIRKNFDFLLCANASKIVFYKDQDLYGIDLCIDLLKGLSNDRIGFIFFLPEINNPSYYKKMIKKIEENNLEKNFIIVHEKKELYPFLEYMDIFIRPTNTDGDAISLREANYKGILTLASDVVVRPKETYTFKTRDIDDLIVTTSKLLTMRKKENFPSNKKNDLTELRKKYENLYTH